MLGTSAQAFALENPGFKNGWDYWTHAGATAISAQAYAGSQSAKISDETGLFAQPLTLVAGRPYRVSGYLLGQARISVTIGPLKYSKAVTASSW